MNDCLLTKLKGVVSDSGLTKLGEMKISIDTDDTTYIVIGGPADGYIYASDGRTLERSGQHDTLPYSNTRAGLSAGNYYLICSDKYSITKVEYNEAGASTALKKYKGISFNIDDLRYSNNLTSIWFVGSDNFINGGDLSSLRDKPLTRLRLRPLDVASILTGDLSNINSSVITQIFLRGQLITGNVSTLVMANTLTDFNIEGCIRVTGTLEDFAAAQVRTSGTMSVHFQNTDITYGGNPITSVKTITFSGGGAVIS